MTGTVLTSADIYLLLLWHALFMSSKADLACCFHFFPGSVAMTDHVSVTGFICCDAGMFLSGGYFMKLWKHESTGLKEISHTFYRWFYTKVTNMTQSENRVPESFLKIIFRLYRMFLGPCISKLRPVSQPISHLINLFPFYLFIPVSWSKL